MNFKKFELEIVRNLCFDIIIKFEDSDFDILTVEKSYGNMTFDINIWIMTFCTELWLAQNHDVLDSVK